MRIQADHALAAILLTVGGVASGAMLTSASDWMARLGVLAGLLTVYVEYLFLRRFDAREPAAKALAEAASVTEEARRVRQDIRGILKEVREMKDQIFDTFSKKGFMKVEERIKALEDQVEGRGGLKEEVDRMKRGLRLW